MNLYQIKNEYLKVFDMLDDPDTDQESVEAALSGIKGDFKEKALNYAAYIKNMEAKVAQMKQYESDMKKRREVIQNRINRESAALMQQMKEVKELFIPGAEFNIKINKCPPALEVTDEVLVDIHFFDIETVKKLNNARLKDALKEGNEIPGARLVQGETLLIK